MKQCQAYNVDKQTHTTNNEHQNWIMHYFYFNEPKTAHDYEMCLQFELLEANKVTLTEIKAITIDTTSESM